MSDRWLEFRVESECEHASDSYGPAECPLCEITRLRVQRNEANQLAGHLKSEITGLQAQVESLQNKCANRGLSPEDSDALQAENERLTGKLQVALDAADYHYEENEKLQARIEELEKALLGRKCRWL